MLMLPPTLIDAVREQRAVLFLGTGASIGARHPKSARLPLGDNLRDQISDHFLKGALKDRNLTFVAATAANEAGLPHLQKYIHDLFDPFQPADFHALVPRFRWKALVTTNFDLIIERAYSTASPPSLQNLVKSLKDGDLFDTRLNNTSNPVGLYKLHGCIEHYTDDSIPLVLGQEQYASYATNRQRFYSRLRDLAYEYPLIFCGYSISDPHIQHMLFDLTDKGVRRPMYYHVGPDTDDIEVRYWATHQIACLKATFAEFLHALDGAIPVMARSLPIALGGGSLSIRKHYRVAGVTESVLLRSYLETDAVHVHAGMSFERQDPIEFYKGYDRGWGCIAQNLDVRRSVCDSVLVDAVLVSENGRSDASLFMLKGPAGNGKTVALKRIAWDAAVDYDQLVLYVTEAAGLSIEPLAEIFRLTRKRIFLFVDRIALLRDELSQLLHSCRARKIQITVIGAERDNEWNIYCEQLERFVRQDFPVHYLSDRSIATLLDLLERHRALGLLIDKSPQQRLEAFTQIAEKQLLVALHETTLGLPFQQIVLDEYKRIEPAEARRLYLDICALHQFGAPVRAGLISRASAISFGDFGRRLIRPLENVVIIQEDKHGKDVYYCSRHRHVAEMVFYQALPSDEDKYDALANLMQAVNIDYSSDNETWGRMIRGRAVARMFSNVDVGRLLYDRAEEITPNEAFVFHQRAVFEMQHPDGSLELADTAARNAFERDEHSRSVRHTQAEIARRQAVETDDPLRKQALRRTAREKLSRETGRPSGYDISTRARLAIDELRELLLSGRDSDAAYQKILLEAVKEAETTINNGIQAFPDSSELLAVESSFRQLLEQADRARQALERAFTLNPRQDWLAVRLSRIYSQRGDVVSAETTLEKCLKENPSSKIAHLSMARIARKLGKSDSLVIEHLRRSFTPGDNHFEGQFWFARELFIQGHVDESKAVFAQLHEHAPGRYRTDASATLNDDSELPVLLRGRTERKEDGYAFVRFTDLKADVFASRADSDGDNWARIRPADNVQGHLAFNRRGPRAIKLALAPR